MNTRSIRFQLLVWYASLLILAFTAFGLFMYAGLGGFLRQNVHDAVARRAHQIARSIAAMPGPVSQKWLQDEIGIGYAPETSGRFVRVTQENTVLYRSGQPQDNSFDPAEIAMPPVANRSRESVRVERQGSGDDVLIASVPVNGLAQPLLIEVGASLAPVHTSLRSMVLCLLIGAPLLIAVAGSGAYILIGRALRPVVTIAASAEQITLHSLDESLPVAKTGDELETLSLALNRMIERIRAAFENTRRFIADASHELRTPLAVLRGEIESVISRNHLTQETRDTLGSNLEEVERLGKIVEGLFALSRLDAGEAHSEAVRFDISALAATTTEQMCLLAEDKRISLQCTSTGPVFVEGDRARLKQVIVNLVDNAIKYTPDGGQVTVRALAEEKEAILEVADNGLGIPREALPLIFERFYRVDKGRSREFGGAGLGLSIVKSICHAHSGTVEAVSREGGGTIFRVHLPLVLAQEAPRNS